MTSTALTQPALAATLAPICPVCSLQPKTLLTETSVDGERVFVPPGAWVEYSLRFSVDSQAFTLVLQRKDETQHIRCAHFSKERRDCLVRKLEELSKAMPQLFVYVRVQSGTRERKYMTRQVKVQCPSCDKKTMITARVGCDDGAYNTVSLNDEYIYVNAEDRYHSGILRQGTRNGQAMLTLDQDNGTRREIIMPFTDMWWLAWATTNLQEKPARVTFQATSEEEWTKAEEGNQEVNHDEVIKGSLLEIVGKLDAYLPEARDTSMEAQAFRAQVEKLRDAQGRELIMGWHHRAPIYVPDDKYWIDCRIGLLFKENVLIVKVSRDNGMVEYCRFNVVNAEQQQIMRGALFNKRGLLLRGSFYPGTNASAGKRCTDELLTAAFYHLKSSGGMGINLQGSCTKVRFINIVDPDNGNVRKQTAALLSAFPKGISGRASHKSDPPEVYNVKYPMKKEEKVIFTILSIIASLLGAVCIYSRWDRSVPETFRGR